MTDLSRHGEMSWPNQVIYSLQEGALVSVELYGEVACQGRSTIFVNESHHQYIELAH